MIWNVRGQYGKKGRKYRKGVEGKKGGQDERCVMLMNPEESKLLSSL
jgi:hypothetical protein